MRWTLNSSTAKAIEPTTFEPFIGKEILEFVVPVFGVIGLIGNLSIIYGMARVKRELSPNLRFYFIILAVADFIDVSYYFGAQFLEYGLFFMTEGTWRHLFFNSSPLSCKIIQVLLEGADTVAGFTVVCLGVERIIAVTWPLRAKRILTLRFNVIFETVVCGVFLLLVEPLLVFVYNLEYTPFYWAPICTWDLSLTIATVYMAIEESIPIVYTVLSLAITVYLTMKILRSTRAHRQLTEASGQSRAENGGKKLSAGELSNVLTLIALSVVHLLIYIPLSFFLLVFLVLLNTPVDQNITMTVYNVGSLFNQLPVIPHSSNVFVYLFRSHAFRVALFGKRCGLPQMSSARPATPRFSSA